MRAVTVFTDTDKRIYFRLKSCYNLGYEYGRKMSYGRPHWGAVIGEKRMNKKIVLILVFIFFVIIQLSAKDSIGFGLQFGALGSEKVFSSSSTISGDTISMPYTKTTFNPDIHILLSFPVCDINDKCFFGLDLGYNFSWDYTHVSFTSYQRETYTLSHRFSLMPEFTYIKSKLHIFAGTGFAFGIEPYKYESIINESYYSDENTDYKLLWTFNAGVKYKLSGHLFAVTDFTFFVNIFDTFTDDDFKSKTSGSNVMELLPKIGLIYQF